MSQRGEDRDQMYAELASFCFRKLANLEARFIILCERISVAGIDCRDLQQVEVPDDERQAPNMPRLVN